LIEKFLLGGVADKVMELLREERIFGEAEEHDSSDLAMFPGGEIADGFAALFDKARDGEIEIAPGDDFGSDSNERRIAVGFVGQMFEIVGRRRWNGTVDRLGVRNACYHRVDYGGRRLDDGRFRVGIRSRIRG
jgi:hypothetical protein